MKIGDRDSPGTRIYAEREFREDCQVLVATEAAGEGINLQFCRLLINYDLPWNPTRLEQRLGRIHRIGQERDVHTFNFVASDSEEGQPIVEGRILARIPSTATRGSRPASQTASTSSPRSVVCPSD